MKITKEVMENLSNLARLKIEEKDVEQIAYDIDKIIQYIDKLSELDTSQIEPMEYLNLSSNVMREDEVKESYDRDRILACVPGKNKEYIIVPRVTFEQ
ncbi:MAG: Asp-tRNA(Asn)/Glu-tRNA(Gln) amidotransferase subunit GatC [Clostridiaceae bacterium]|jgi:aspartyl-tRNA(Asn)/glutamyl-tRNA(Gln) amidotransferase subunit C|nr:Asp-tRNA(Asn)/Glu-tRNA(Gln) amidotransferase subunit GatC [Clostridiaceae bacterium]